MLSACLSEAVVPDSFLYAKTLGDRFFKTNLWVNLCKLLTLTFSVVYFDLFGFEESDVAAVSGFRKAAYIRRKRSIFVGTSLGTKNTGLAKTRHLWAYVTCCNHNSLFVAVCLSNLLKQSRIILQNIN